MLHPADPIEVSTTTDPREFARRTGDFLAARVERNVLATVLMGILDGGYADVTPRFAYGMDAAGEVCLAALRTPPWPLMISELDPAMAAELLDTWLRSDPGLPGVSGTGPAARALAETWCERSGGSARVLMRQALHSLEEVRDPPRPASGSLRLPRPDERSLLEAWNEAFVLEAGLPRTGRVAAMVEQRLRHDGLLLWEDGAPVSMVGMNPPVAGAVRIGPVYTPPGHRRRGYAGSAVAAISRRALAAGATRCLLFTDLANPTSNKIYAEVGYVRGAEWDDYEFLSAPAA